jgi:hypothetical protein
VFLVTQGKVKFVKKKVTSSAVILENNSSEALAMFRSPEPDRSIFVYQVQSPKELVRDEDIVTLDHLLSRANRAEEIF